MTYRTEFPDFDFEVPTVVTGDWDFEDSSWKNDTCPSFTCDVFVLFIDYTDRAKREFPETYQFSMQCEGQVVLATNDWEDVRRFVEDGYRPPLPWGPLLDPLVTEFNTWTEANGLSEQGDAQELLMLDLTPERRTWLTDFSARWTAAQAAQDSQEVAAPLWTLGSTHEYENGHTAEVVHVDAEALVSGGQLAVVRKGARFEPAYRDAALQAEGDTWVNPHPDEADFATLDEAVEQMVACREARG